MALAFLFREDALWYSVIKSKYGLNENQWDSGINHLGTHRNPWKYISSLYGEFHSLVAFKVGNGTKLRFWEDVWRGGTAFKFRFPTLYRLSSKHNGSIANFRSEANYEGGWNFSFRRNIRDCEMEELVELLECLTNFQLSSALEDSRLWLPDSSHIFSCKSTFNKLRETPDTHIFFPFKLI